MTVHVDAGRIECFYHPANVGNTIDIEYQVIDGGHGDLDISFSLTEPVGLIITADHKKSENVIRHHVLKDGDYRFCFDNSFSTFNRKTVFFEFILEKEDAENDDDHLEGYTPEEFYDMTVQDIMDYIARIRMNLHKSRQFQDMLRSNEARDRNIAEANYYKVNAWSLFQMCSMIIMGCLQVFMLKSIFETGTKMNRLLDKLHF